MRRALSYLLLALALAACIPASAPHRNPSSAPFTLCREAETAAKPVWQGRGGWLFNQSDLIARFDPSVPVRPGLERVVRAFEAQGVTLVAVVLPTRGSVYDSKLDRRKSVFAGYEAAAARASYRAFLAELRAAGVLAPDLSGVVHSGSDPFFFKRDQHWTSAGARRAAGAVARLLRPLPVYTELTKTDFHTRSLGRVKQKGWLQERAESLCGTSYPMKRWKSLLPTARRPTSQLKRRCSPT